MRNMNWTAFLSASAEEDYYEQHSDNWSQHSKSLAYFVIRYLRVELLLRC